MRGARIASEIEQQEKTLRFSCFVNLAVSRVHGLVPKSIRDPVLTFIFSFS